MERAKLIELLTDPEKINGESSVNLESLLQSYPYFQAARAVQLKYLGKTNSYTYNNALKKTAAYTVDRQVLFNFITDPLFFNHSTAAGLETGEAKTLEGLHKKVADRPNTAPLPEEVHPVTEEETLLEIGRPLHFRQEESHSFMEWMQLVAQQPIDRSSQETEKPQAEQTSDKFKLITRFIDSKPKIVPQKSKGAIKDISAESTLENTSLMTETLAKVYLEQKKYSKAIKAYHILSLKYPEKSGFFADRIRAIKILQKNKS